MDITTIDAVSYATRVAQTAAAELYGLLSTDTYAGPIQYWFNPELAHASPEELAPSVDALGGYVVAHQVEQGERLYRWGRDRALIPFAPWADLDFAGRQAFATFVEIARSTWQSIAANQKAIEDLRRERNLPPPPRPDLEDTIYEPVGSMWEERPEMAQAAPFVALYEQGRQDAAAQVAREARDAAAAAVAAEAAQAEKLKAETAARPRAGKPAPMSAGATAPAHQPNRGGRGKRKAP